MGIRKAKEPMSSKERIRPAIMVTTTTDPPTLGPLAQNRVSISCCKTSPGLYDLAKAEQNKDFAQSCATLLIRSGMVDPIRIQNGQSREESIAVISSE